jgi:DNA invertase Pin-like site-specific DNA recombinase
MVSHGRRLHRCRSSATRECQRKIRRARACARRRSRSTAYATVKDWTLREVVREEGVNAKSLKRPGLARVLAGVKEGKVGAVVVYKLDRLTRKPRHNRHWWRIHKTPLLS